MNQAGGLAIKAGFLWDGRNASVIPNAVIVVENGRITQIAPAREFSDEIRFQIDWSDYMVMPGLIDCHTHLSMDPTLDNYLDRMNDSVSELTARAKVMMKKDLESGVTTCRCLGDRELVDVSCRQLVNDHPDSGPDLLIAIRGIKKRNAPGFVGYPFDNKVHIQQAITENISQGADLTKIYITGTLRNHGEIESYLEFDEIKTAIEHSHNLGVRVATHCVGGVGLDWAMDLGIDTVEHLYHVSDRQIEKLAGSSVWPVLTPGPILTELRVRNLPHALISGHLGEKEAITERMAAVINSGIPYAVGTDGMHGDLVQEIKYLLDMGASPFESLSAATYHSACASGINGETGSLEIGKKADLIAVKGDPFENINALKSIKGVMKTGELVFESNE